MTTTALGSDRRIVRHLAPRGVTRPPEGARRPHAVVVGGGIAGLSAATGLAERGVRVELLEREDCLGGRVAAWRERIGDGSPVSMSRGFHAFFRQYYNLRQLLRRTDPQLRRLVSLTDYPLVDEHGRRDGFRGLPRTPPWNALAFALRSPTFRMRDLFALDVRAAAPLAAVSVPETYRQLDDIDADTFLRRINFPEAARHLAFEVFSRSFFAAPSQLSAAELATMFHLYFLGSSEGLVFDVPESTFDVSLWSPLREHLTELGAHIRTSTAVTRIEVADGYRVHDDTGAVTEADAVVLATDVAGLRRLVGDSENLGDPAWRESVSQLRTAPPFLVQRLWLDRPVAPQRPPFLGVGDTSPLDNISVLDRYENEASEWAKRNGGCVLELHAYAAGAPGADMPAGLRERLLHRLHELYPETATATIVGELVRWRQDCPLFGVGQFVSRPRVRTPHDGLVLAGDGVRIDLPVALMERAATTGWHAANCLLARWGLAGHELYSVPTSGRFGPLHRLAARGGRTR